MSYHQLRPVRRGDTVLAGSVLVLEGKMARLSEISKPLSVEEDKRRKDILAPKRTWFGRAWYYGIYVRDESRLDLELGFMGMFVGFLASLVVGIWLLFSYVV